MIRQRRAGWQVLVYAGIDPVTGRQRYITRQVNGGKREAAREEARLRAEVAAGKHRGTGARTLAELLDVWFAWRTTNGKPLSPATRNDYESLVDTKLEPALGSLRLPQVGAAILDRYYGQLLLIGRAVKVRDGKDPATGKPRWRTEQAPLSPSRIHQVHAVLSGALRLATRYGWIPFNPATLAEPPSGKGKRRPVPTTDNVREVMRATAEREPELYLIPAPGGDHWRPAGRSRRAALVRSRFGRAHGDDQRQHRARARAARRLRPQAAEERPRRARVGDRRTDGRAVARPPGAVHGTGRSLGRDAG